MTSVHLFPSLSEVEEYIKTHEETYTVKYVTLKKDKSFTSPIDPGKN